MNVIKVIKEKKTFSSPPPPPIRPKRNNDDGDNGKQLTAIVKWEGKDYHVECCSRKLTSNFRFHNPELGEVIYAEDQTTLLYSQKELDPEIYKKLRFFIKCWADSFPDF